MEAMVWHEWYAKYETAPTRKNEKKPASAIWMNVASPSSELPLDYFSLGAMTGACRVPISYRQESDDYSDFTESGCVPLGGFAVITFLL